MQRINFKILSLTTNKALNNFAPSYMTDLLHRHSPTRRLRSADANLLLSRPIALWGTEPSPSPPLPSGTLSLCSSETLTHSVHSKVNLIPISSGPPTTFDKSSSAIFHSLPLSECVAFDCGVVYFFPFCLIVCTVCMYSFLICKASLST